jgi:F-type H+-transporting ATPase subunit b
MKLSPSSRTGILAVLLVAAAGIVLLRAQNAAPTPAPEQTRADDTRRTPGREMVHASNESVGREENSGKEEKDEMEEFKHSPSVQLISRLTGLSLQQAYWASVVLNFALIAAVFIWAGRKFLPGIFRDRTAAIQRAMQEAQKASQEARRKLAEIESRLQKLDVEIGMMRNAAEEEGAAEEARIKAAAEEDARKIVASAEQEIDAAAKAARRQLTAHAAELAVGLAQKQIHVDAATDQALVRSFVAQLGSEGSGKDRR